MSSLYKWMVELQSVSTVLMKYEGTVGDVPTFFFFDGTARAAPSLVSAARFSPCTTARLACEISRLSSVIVLSVVAIA